MHNPVLHLNAFPSHVTFGETAVLEGIVVPVLLLVLVILGVVVVLVGKVVGHWDGTSSAPFAQSYLPSHSCDLRIHWVGSH